MMEFIVMNWKLVEAWQVYDDHRVSQTFALVQQDRD